MKMNPIIVTASISGFFALWTVLLILFEPTEIKRAEFKYNDPAPSKEGWLDSPISPEYPTSAYELNTTIAGSVRVIWDNGEPTFYNNSTEHPWLSMGGKVVKLSPNHKAHFSLKERKRFVEEIEIKDPTNTP